ncbi:unnamed protein product, partial [Meganyctiphanes norvegica]
MEERSRQRPLQSVRGTHNGQDSDEDDDLQDAQLWNHRRLQQQVGFLGIGRSFPGELSPQPSSSGCEQRVSPLDPNLSSAACYSPQPPYSSPIGALNQPDSPIEVLAHSGTLATIQPSSNISSAGESIAALPRPQARWPHEAAMSYEDDEDERNDDDDDDDEDDVDVDDEEDNDDNENDINAGASQKVGDWDKGQHVQRAQGSSPQPGRSTNSASPRPGPSGLQPLRPAVDCDSDTDDEQNHRGFMSVNPHLVNSNFNQNNNSEEAEALETFGSDCEASSSDRDHMSPLGSPRTPGDNCVVSSSTGQIDSVPPTPVEFQGNDASAPPSPSSPSSPHRMVGVAILDSTVDSSSGRGLEAPGRDMSGDSDENEENNATGRGSIIIPGIHRVEEGAEAAAVVSDSPSVELLANPQPTIFGNNPSNDKRFKDQLSFSLSNLSDRYNSSHNSNQDHMKNRHSSVASGSQPYLVIPGSSRASLPGHPHSESVSVTKNSLKRVFGLDQPTTSKTNIHSNAVLTPYIENRKSVAETNSEPFPYSRSVTKVELGNRDQLKDHNNLISGSISTTASTSQNIIGSLGERYVIGLNENSLNSDGSLSSGNGLGEDGEVETLAEGSSRNLDYDKLRTLNLNLLSSEEMDSNLNKDPSGSGSSANEQTGPQSLRSPTHVKNASEEDSQIVGNNEDSNDGTLLMMVSSNGHSLHSALSLALYLQYNIHNSSLDINLDHQQESEANILEASRADLEERKEIFDEKKDFDDPLSTSENAQDDFITPDFWCGECGQSYAYECLQHRVLTISDKPVMTRAWASLPAAHLTIKAIPEENCSGVFSRKLIPQRTQFGPLEGVMSQDSTGNPSQGLLYTLDRGEHFLHIDTTDESFCNWMKFVRPASAYLEQNCIVFQQGKGLYFLTTTKILPRTEIRVGYSKVYAERRNLQYLEPTADELKFLESQRKTWSCYECDESFESSAQLQQHLNNHDENVGEEKKKKKKYKSRRVRGIEESEELVRKGAKKLKVDAQATASTSQLETERNKQEISDSPIIYKCKICGIHFNSHELDEIHSLGHDEEKNNENEEYNNTIDIKLEKSRTDCPECNKKFESTPDLVNHVNEHGFYSHSSKAYKCNYCYKSFSREERLSAHMSVHGNEAEKPFSCSYCLRRFCNNSALTCHIKVHTEGRKGYDCPICRDTFGSVSQLKSHVKLHCVNGEYLCPTCHKKFLSYNKIRRHIRSYHAVTPVKCTICSKDLPSHDKLKIHMLSHSDRRDFLCPDCGKRFKRKDKLREHIKRMHSTERETKTEKFNNKGPPKFIPKVDPTDYQQFVYKCHNCLLGFKRRGMLVNHLAKRHPQIAPSSVPELNQPILKATRCYYCQYCEKMYRSSSKRKLHILKNHPGAELPPPTKRENEPDTGDDPSFSQTMGATPVYAHSCQWCHRQYASKARLLRHHRQNHPDLFNEEAAAGILPYEYEADAPDRAAAHVSGEVGMLLDGHQALAGEFALEGQIVAEGNIIRGHRLVSIGGNGSGRRDGSSDLLTQAMGETLGSGAHSEQQYVRLVSSGSGRGRVATAGESEGSINDGGSNCGTTTLALVTADGTDHTVTISLPPGQFISLIPGLSVAGGSVTTSTSRSITSTSSSVVALEAPEPGSSNRSGLAAHSGEVAVSSFMTPTIAQPVPQQEAEAQEEMVMHDSHTLTTLTNS